MSEQDYNIISLPDGRELAFAEYGAPQGQPLFFFSRLSWLQIRWCIYRAGSCRDGESV